MGKPRAQEDDDQPADLENEQCLPGGAAPSSPGNGGQLPRLLRQLDLDQDRVLVELWSEFGRRALQNDSNGTDHGAAGVGFLMGTRVADKMVGEFRGLQKGLDKDGNLKQSKVKVSSIAALSNDLALALSASPIRIEAPVPGKGIVGLEVPNPHSSIVSLRGVIPLSWNLDHAGPMARCVWDVALLLQAIAGYDPEDPWSEDLPVDDYLAQLDDGVQGWRVALAGDEYFTMPEIVDPEVTAAVQQAGRVFESLGARVEVVPFPSARDAAVANGLMTMADAAAFHRERIAEAPQQFGPDVLGRLQRGASFTSSEYSQARRTQAVLRHQFVRFLDGTDTGQPYDLLLTPATPIPAPGRGSADAAERANLLTRFTSPFNLTGLPALAMPCGVSRAGLPLGLQIVARPWAEASLLRAAQAYEKARAWSLDVTEFTL